LCCADDVLKRFSAYGWTTKRVDGHDPAQISSALSLAMRSKKPTLIACHSAADPGGPVLSAGNGLSADPSGDGGAMQSQSELTTNPETELVNRWHAGGSRGASARRSWLKRLARHAQRAEFERVMAGRLPDTWQEALAELKRDSVDNRPRIATGTASRTCLETLVPMIPELIGGIADPDPAIVTAPIAAGNFGGRHIHCGMRAHGMAAAANGMALHGGIIPCVATALALSDELRPAVRLSAIMRHRVVYVLTQESAGSGADGSLQPSVEHLAGLRAMPNLHVFRPADAMETAECWELAIRRADGPSLLVVSGRKQPPWRTDLSENRSARGGYVLAEADGPRQATLIATGPELAIAMAARAKLAGDNIAVAVVSLPCWELFARQDAAYRAQVLGGAPRVGIEAAGDFGWAQWLGPDGTFIGVIGFAAPAHDEDLYTHFGITPEAVAAAVTRRLG
jgi:transketolase